MTKAPKPALQPLLLPPLLLSGRVTPNALEYIVMTDPPGTKYVGSPGGVMSAPSGPTLISLMGTPETA